MGICSSSSDKSQDELNNSGPGLPPKEIIPQPIEVSNITPDLNAKITSKEVPAEKLDISQNQQFNSINSNIEPTNQPVNQSLNISNQNVNDTNLNNNLNNSLPQTQILKSNNIQGNIPTLGELHQATIYQSQNGNHHLGKTNQQSNKRVYLVVQLPQREIEITKLFEYHCLAQIEQFITPDSIDEYDFYDAKRNSLNEYLYTPFNEWHDIYRTLRIKLIRAGLNIVNDIREYISKRTHLIGCLTFDKPNSFGIFVFNKTNNSTLSFEYSTNIYLQMKTVNQFSAYCNALNKLYISGGEIANNQANDSFICVDLNEVQQNIFVPTQLCYLKKRRYWHSMIYIPENFIFIVGGPNEIDVELYDIEKNITVIDSHLNTERCEPSLILVNNKFLYAFFGFHLYESFINTIERCNIRKKRRTWENVEYKLNNTLNLAKAFFGVSYIENNILLISDKENQDDLKPNYILTSGTGNIDTISEEGILNSRNTRLFAEKFFIPFTETESINLAFKSGEPKIFIVNNENGAINELCMNES